MVLEGPDQWVVPCPEVLPKSVIPAVRICQAVVRSLMSRLEPCRLFVKGGDSAADVSEVPLGDVYFHDISAVYNSSEMANQKCKAESKHIAAHGLPTEEEKFNPTHLGG